MITHGRRGSLDNATVEEARRAMISAGYVLPPQFQPIPVELPPTRLQPTAAAAAAGMPLPMAARRRHSISCSPVAGIPVATPDSPTSLTGCKRRYSLPGGGLGTPLTDFLPSEFKRQRTSPEPVPEEPRTSTLLPSISNLINQPTIPEPCLPPHTAATPDHPHFVPSVSVPVSLKEKQTLAPVCVQQPLAVDTPPPRAPWAALAYASSPFSSSSSPSPSSSAPSSPGLPDLSSADQQQKRSLEDEAEKERKAQRVAEIIDLMDRQNCAAGADSVGGGGGGSWSGDLKRRRVGKDQTGTLDLVFKVEQMPSQAVKKRLADGLGMTYKQVQIWFQNKRARCKRAVEAPPRSSHTFHNMHVSSDGRFMMKDLAKSQQHQQQPQAQPLVRYHHHHAMPSPSPSASPLPLRSCILSR